MKVGIGVGMAAAIMMAVGILIWIMGRKNIATIRAAGGVENLQ